LVLLERQARDRGWWQQMRACFAPDATVRLSWFDGSGADFVTQSEKMAGRGEISRHRLGPPIVRVNGSRSVVEMSASIEIRTELNGVEVDLISYTRLIYRSERAASRWQIVSLDPIYERDTLTPSMPGTKAAVAPADLAGLRPSYRLLAYLLHERGYDIREDLYGDDRPEAVAAFNRDLLHWLEHAPPNRTNGTP
jgi:hypothetical protein